jgi:putative ABC transport system permease protein
MIWKECLQLALSALHVDKLKAFLTTLSVTIGSAAIVLVITVAGTGKTFIMSRVEGIGTNVAFATLDRDKDPTTLEDELTPGDLVAIHQSIPMAVAAAGAYDLPADFQLHGRTHHARLVGVTEDFRTIRNLRIDSGRYFDRRDFASRNRVCLVTDQIASASFASGFTDGLNLKMEQFNCTVIGVFREGVPTFGQSEIQADTILVPFPLVKPITGDNYYQVIYAQAASSADVPAMTAKLEHVLRNRHRKQAHYSVQNLSSLLQIADKVSVALYAILLGTGMITLIVGGTGIMNIMFATVAERKQEIGLRKALGARPSEIRLQFLMEASLISLIGAIAGVVVAVALLIWAAGLIKSEVDVQVSWEGVAVAMLLTTLIGILFGYQPASKAATLNPVEALRADA